MEKMLMQLKEHEVFSALSESEYERKNKATYLIDSAIRERQSAHR